MVVADDLVEVAAVVRTLAVLRVGGRMMGGA